MSNRQRQFESSEVRLGETPVARRPPLLHPLLIFSAVWLGVTFLYSLHLSRILQYSSAEAVTTGLYLWTPFFAVSLAYMFFRNLLKLAYPGSPSYSAPNLHLLERRLAIWFRIWVGVTLLETIVSGGLPIVWIFTHSSKNYLDFGIPSLHGLVNSLLLSISISRMALFLLTGERKHLRIPIFAICWYVIAITRNLMIVSLLEFAIIFIQMRLLRGTLILKFIVGLLCLVLAFGIIGDLRQGSGDAIRSLAQPTDQYPEWLPSGVLWAYIYITTPINNLIYTMQSTHPLNDVLFPNTAATLFPTVIRMIIYGDQLGAAESGQLVDSAFNVSTAYIGPFQDYGLFGISMMSALAAIISGYFWYRRNLQGILMFAVVTQCLILTLFFNHFFTLPIISQLVWLAYFCLPKKLYFGRRTTSTLLLPEITPASRLS